MTITTVGLDADDTLWHNETVFRLTQARFLDLLTDHDNAAIEARLAEIERRNLRLYGYGVKGFTLSMIETAMEMCDGEPPARVIREILAAGREMLAHPVETLPGVDEALARLSERYRLVLITKGDLLDQERKLAASGLGDLFAAVEIVSEKDRSTYERVFARHGTGVDEAVMAGNSMKSDVLPALEAGAFAVHIPYASPGRTRWPTRRRGTHATAHWTASPTSRTGSMAGPADKPLLLRRPVFRRAA